VNTEEITVMDVIRKIESAMVYFGDCDHDNDEAYIAYQTLKDLLGWIKMGIKNENKLR
jgi:hypothetical protein